MVDLNKIQAVNDSSGSNSLGDLGSNIFNSSFSLQVEALGEPALDSSDRTFP